MVGGLYTRKSEPNLELKLDDNERVKEKKERKGCFTTCLEGELQI